MRLVQNGLLNDFRDYLTNLVHSLMYLRPGSPFEIVSITKQLNSNKNRGPDGVEAKFVQLAAETIAPALCFLFTACFENGFFPTCLKEAKIVPVFKSGDRPKLITINPYRYCFVSRKHWKNLCTLERSIF